MKHKILGLLAVGLLAGPVAANAVVITVAGQGSADGQWDVQTTIGSYDDLSSTLNSQVWWGNGLLANVFRDLVGAALGTPNDHVGASVGPFFGHHFEPFLIEIVYHGGAGGGSTNLVEVWTWAIATRSAVPEPGTLALLGLGLLGLGVMRRRAN